MANLTPQNIPVPPTAAAARTFASAAGGGDAFLNSGAEEVIVKNAGVGSINWTVVAQRACNHGTVHSIITAIPAGEERSLKNLDPARFNDANGYVQMTYSGVTSVTVAVTR